MQKFDEMYALLPFDGSDVRAHYKRYGQWLARQAPKPCRRGVPRPR